MVRHLKPVQAQTYNKTRSPRTSQAKTNKSSRLKVSKKSKFLATHIP